MSQSARAKVDPLLRRQSPQLRDQIIHEICAALEVQLYGPEKVTTSQ